MLGVDNSATGRPSSRPGRLAETTPGDGTLTEAEATEIARTVILNRLDRSSASRAQLAQLCVDRAVPGHLIVSLLDRFEEVGLIDDAAYAARLVRTRHRERQLAGNVLRLELTRKGLSGEAVEQALAQIDSESELAAARVVVAKRLERAALRQAPREVQQRRLFGTLGRKGHSPAVAYRVITEALGEGD